MLTQRELTDLTTPPPIWSEYQQAIFDEFRSGTGNFVVKAYAGVGKTTTAIEGIRHAPEQRILLTAFNNKNAVALSRKLSESGNPRAEAKTAHALGFSIVRQYRDRLIVEKKENAGDRAAALTLAVCGLAAPDPILRLVTKLHTQGRENAPHATTVGDLTALAIKFECEPDDQWTRCRTCGRAEDDHDEFGLPIGRVPDHAYFGFNLEYVETKALAAMTLAATVQSGGTIDFADMIFLPVRNGWIAPQYDLGVIDEAQDFTLTQLEIAQGVCRGRIAIIGDRNQAIYAFRGADSESIDRLKNELHAKEFKLPTTYRCGKAIVREAQRYVPDFEAGADNPEGEVLYLDLDKLTADAGPSNFILSRTNAPLVSIAMKLLRLGKRTRIAGRDIGTGLKTLIRKFRARSVPDLLAKISAWEKRDVARTTIQLNVATNGRKRTLQAKIDGIIDQAEMLSSLADGARNVEEVIDRVDALFTDDGLGDAGIITCSSVHKAKGMEADKVYVLTDTLRDHNQEERNIAYVAITRAKNTLVYVSDPANK